MSAREREFPRMEWGRVRIGNYLAKAHWDDTRNSDSGRVPNSKSDVAWSDNDGRKMSVSVIAITMLV
jgi:hypothetical protein